MAADAPPRDGDIVVARVNGHSLIRRFRRSDHGVALAPDSENAALKPVTFPSTGEVPVRGIVEAIYLKQLR